ncbi:MAG TPA: hypothetical protein VIO11_09510 [Candidatus Methanoperedens sp.]
MEKTGFEFIQEFFDLGLKHYEATAGGIVEIPAIGPAREKS